MHLILFPHPPVSAEDSDRSMNLSLLSAIITLLRFRMLRFLPRYYLLHNEPKNLRPLDDLLPLPILTQCFIPNNPPQRSTEFMKYNEV